MYAQSLLDEYWPKILDILFIKKGFKGDGGKICRADRYILGYVLGEKIFKDLMQEKLSLKELREIYSSKYQGNNGKIRAFATYLTLIGR